MEGSGEEGRSRRGRQAGGEKSRPEQAQLHLEDCQRSEITRTSTDKPTYVMPLEGQFRRAWEA